MLTLNIMKLLLFFINVSRRISRRIQHNTISIMSATGEYSLINT